MKSIDELKAETKSELDAARDRRLDRTARDNRDGPILDAFDRMARGDAVEYTPGPRHAAKLAIADPDPKEELLCGNCSWRGPRSSLTIHPRQGFGVCPRCWPRGYESMPRSREEWDRRTHELWGDE